MQLDSLASSHMWAFISPVTREMQQHYSKRACSLCHNEERRTEMEWEKGSSHTAQGHMLWPLHSVQIAAAFMKYKKLCGWHSSWCLSSSRAHSSSAARAPSFSSVRRWANRWVLGSFSSFVTWSGPRGQLLQFWKQFKRIFFFLKKPSDIAQPLSKMSNFFHREWVIPGLSSLELTGITGCHCSPVFLAQ